MMPGHFLSGGSLSIRLVHTEEFKHKNDYLNAAHAARLEAWIAIVRSQSLDQLGG
jgi:hypothetical protein